MMLLMYVTFIVPVRVCFFINVETTPEYTGVEIFELFLDSLFISDIFVNFITAYHDEHTFDLVVSPAKIAMRYIRFWFFIDVVACFPINLVLKQTGQSGASSNVNRISKLVRLPRMFKLLRLLRLMKLLRILRVARIFERMNINTDKSFFQGFKVFFYVSVVTHLVACLWYLIGSLEEGPESWVQSEDLIGHYATLSNRYVSSLYWAFSSLTTVGFGDIRAHSDMEKLFSIVVMICGVTWYAFIISTLSSLLSGWDRKHVMAKKRMQEMTEFIRDVKVPKDLAGRVREYTEYCVKHDKSIARGYKTDTLLKSLSPELRDEIVIHM